MDDSDAHDAACALSRHAHVFISHASEDVAKANSLVDALEASGIACWIAPRDIPTGADYRVSILQAIDSAAATVVLLSRHAAKSPHVGREVHRAVDRGERMRIVPVRLELAELGPQLEYDLSVLQWIDAHQGPFEHHIGKIVDLLADAKAPSAVPPVAADWGNADVAASAQQRAPYWEHRLAPALHFVGRRNALGQIKALWDAHRGCVLAIEGMGGSGKTSMLEQFLRGLEDGTLAPPDSLFCWSFYESIDSAAFVESLCDYHGLDRDPNHSSQHQLRQLKRQLTNGDRHVLVLDGMERIQQERRVGPRARRVFGEITDPLVRDLLRSVAGGLGRTVALTTSRFPLVDCQPWSSRGGFETILLDQLSEEDAHELLRSHGVVGQTSALGALTSRYGRHALTLTHLSGLIVRFFGGDANSAPVAARPEVDGVDVSTRRLESVLASYESYLSPAELAVMQASTVFRHAVPAEEVLDLVTRLNTNLSQLDVRGALDMLVRYHLLSTELDGTLNAHPAVRDYFSKTYSRIDAARDARIAQMQPRIPGLSERPGRIVNLSKASLDGLEEIVIQLHDAGRQGDARRTYHERLGGGRFLASCGESVRGLRVLEAITEEPYAEDPDGYFDMRRRVGDLIPPGGRLTYVMKARAEETQLLLGRLKDLPFAAASMLRGDEPPIHASGVDFAPRFQYHLLRGWAPPDAATEATGTAVIVDDLGNAFHVLDDTDLVSLARHAERADIVEQLQEMQGMEQRLALGPARNLAHELATEFRRWLEFVQQARLLLGPPIPAPNTNLLQSLLERAIGKLIIPRLPQGYAAHLEALAHGLKVFMYSGGVLSAHWHEWFGDEFRDLEWSLIHESTIHLFSTHSFLTQADEWDREQPNEWEALDSAIQQAGADLDFGQLRLTAGTYAARFASMISKDRIVALDSIFRRTVGGTDLIVRASRLDDALMNLTNSFDECNLGARTELCVRSLGFRRESNRRTGALDDLICWALLRAERARQDRGDPWSDLQEAQELMREHFSVEHQCLVDLVTARVELDRDALGAAAPGVGLQAALSGQRQARNAGYRILEIDLTCEVARANLLAGNLDAAMAESARAIALGDESVCGYVWGSCYAAAILALAARRSGHASATDAVLDFRKRLEPLRGNPWFDATLAHVGIDELASMQS